MFSRVLFVVLILLPMTWSCASQRRVAQLQREGVAAHLELGSIDTLPHAEELIRDTMKVVGLGGETLYIMRAEKDEQGDMVAQDVLDAAVVTARFRNVAERNGRVDIGFNVIVPSRMQDSRWQIRFSPQMYVLGDTVSLEPVIITGAAYRKAQLRGYQQYDRFLQSIVQDSTRFVNLALLEIFLQRNIPQLYAFKTDSTVVSDEQFRSIYGVSQREAVEHYTNKISRGINNRKKSMQDKMYQKYVKVPILTSGVRLDTVVQSLSGDLVYEYTQSVNTRPNLKKIDVALSGGIYDGTRCVYEMQQSSALSFYISSLSAFVDTTRRFLTKIVERRVSEKISCRVDFELGKWEVREDYASNDAQLGLLRNTLASLMENEIFDVDSVIVCASSSPEGRVDYNRALSLKRSSAMAQYLDAAMRSLQDSLQASAGILLDENGVRVQRQFARVPFLSASLAENWPLLDLLVQADTLLSEREKHRYGQIRKDPAPDRRESSLKKEKFYPYMKSNLFPRVRTVELDFFLSRKGMVKDTLHTTVPDTLYSRGVQRLVDRDFAGALEILSSYADYNAALAYSALDRNYSALEILRPMPPSPRVNYMLAILYYRTGKDREAVQAYLDAVREDRSYVFRGNLDPEINELVRLYSLDNILNEDTFF